MIRKSGVVGSTDSTVVNRKPRTSRILLWTVACCGWAAAADPAQAQQSLPFTLPEQRSLPLPDENRFPAGSVLATDVPYTVSDRDLALQAEPLSLDEAIRVALANARVVRFLAGVTASTSGRTIYDVAINNTGIDVQNALFDPNFSITSTLNKSDRPGAIPDPLNPGQSLITGSSTDSVNTSISLSQRMMNGADIGLNLTPVGSYFEPGLFPLDPQYDSGVEMTLRQPLLRGYGRPANLAPVVVARIDTERSYFQYKDSVQELVRGVIDGYWSLVAARVEVWAREQQVEQAEFAYQRAKARKEEGLERAADVAQAESALANFRASLITARSSRILAETALRNLLGLDPSATSELVPVSEPVRERIEFDWAYLLVQAERQRPDIVELKLILEADRQLLVQAANQARPQFDGIANYRWDGLQGEMPNGTLLRSGPGQFAGWNVGVNFSVPLGLRQSRAGLRRQELLLCRDQANLEQGLHQMTHQLTVNYRNLAQFHDQIDAFGKAREAALVNFENQMGEFQSGRQNFLNVLQAITDWGNAVAQEARSVTQYNSELASIERETGTILENHGIVFYEERYSSLGPLGRAGSRINYPSTLSASPDGQIRYPDSGRPAEESFDLQDPGEGLREGPDGMSAPDEAGSGEPPLPSAEQGGAGSEEPPADGSAVDGSGSRASRDLRPGRPSLEPEAAAPRSGNRWKRLFR